MKGQGHQIFVDRLMQFAAEHADPGVTAIVERTAAPLRVVVRGRRGVGCSTVARALDGAGTASGIVARTGAAPSPRAAGRNRDADLDTDDVDIVVYVTTEVVKPEDAEAIGAAGCPVVAVLNKADLVGSLSGRGGDGPVAAARMRCADLSALAGVPMVPMIGLLGVAALAGPDDALWAALQTLAAHPGGAAGLDGSIAGFLAASNPVPTDVRLRLLDTFGLFGTALGVAAVRQGRTGAQVRVLLRRLSGVDAVLARVALPGAELRYQRVLDAVAELEALAVGRPGLGELISGFLSHDDTVIARMAAAVDLAEATGLDRDSTDGSVDLDREPAGHLSRAVRWQRYSRGSVSDLHRACGADIARGSLRLWAQTGGFPLVGLPGEAW